MKQIKNGTGQSQFDILASVMVDILILFHSSFTSIPKTQHVLSRNIPIPFWLRLLPLKNS